MIQAASSALSAVISAAELVGAAVVAVAVVVEGVGHIKAIIQKMSTK